MAHSTGDHGRGFSLDASPPPSPRTLQGRRDRQMPSYQARDPAYNIIQVFMEAWRAGRRALSPRVAEAFGVATVADFLLRKRQAFRPIMRRLNCRTLSELLTRYGRVGWHRWQWDHHPHPLRECDVSDPAQRAVCLHYTNLKPTICAENKFRTSSSAPPPGQLSLPLDPMKLDVIERARRYLETLPDAIAGQGGHSATFRAATVLVNGFALDETTALPLLEAWNAAHCRPAWEPRALLHKLRGAGRAKHTHRCGHLLGSDPPPSVGPVSPGDNSPSPSIQ